MDKVLLKRAAIQSFTLMLAVVMSSFALQQYQTVTTAASNITNEAAAGVNSILEGSFEQSGNISADQSTLQQELSPNKEIIQMDQALLNRLGNPIDQEVLSQLCDNYIVVEKPKAKQLSISLEDLYINRSIRLTIKGEADGSMDNYMITRVRGKEFFSGDPKYTEVTGTEKENDGTTKEIITRDYGNDLSHGISITSSWVAATKQYASQITIVLDSVYAYTIYEDSNNFYIDLRKPSEVYDKILVMDAGHGGKDGGALSRDETVFEKNINLEIMLDLKELLDRENIKVYYTRTADDTVFLRPREELANAVDCDYFISIHCNAYDSSEPNGTEVLYYDTHFKGVAADELATVFSEEIGSTVSLERRGITKKQMGDIFIMDKAQVPMILIEVGYLTNGSDLAYLCKAENRRAVAQGIYNGIMRAYKELPVKDE